MKLMNSRFLLFVLALILIAALPAALQADETEGEQAATPEVSETETPELTEEQTRLNVESFDHVWTTIRDKHFDPELGGLDWEAIREELRPQVEEATTMGEARAPMHEMIDRLGQSHFAVIPDEVYEAIGNPGEQGILDGGPGFDVRVSEGQALVTSLSEGSPAAEAGVKTGWVVLAVEGSDLAPKLEKITEQFEGTTWLEGVLSGSVINRLQGPVDESITVTFLDGEDKEQELKIIRVEKKGKKIKVGHLPSMRVWIDTKRLEGNIGYIAFNHFMDPVTVMAKYNKAVQEFADARGLIIDVRGNGGGLPGMSMGMVGWFVKEKNLYLGTVYFRETDLKLIVNPRFPTYTKPVVVLQDGLSASAAEFFSGGAQDLGAATIVGTRTIGAALPSVFERLPNGDGFQYAFANYISAGGEVLEGKGVTPDITVMPTRRALLDGRDPALEVATALIWKETAEAEEGKLPKAQ